MLSSIANAGATQQLNANAVSQTGGPVATDGAYRATLAEAIGSKYLMVLGDYGTGSDEATLNRQTETFTRMLTLLKTRFHESEGGRAKDGKRPYPTDQLVLLTYGNSNRVSAFIRIANDLANQPGKPIESIGIVFPGDPQRVRDLPCSHFIEVAHAPAAGEPARLPESKEPLVVEALKIAVEEWQKAYPGVPDPGDKFHGMYATLDHSNVEAQEHALIQGKWGWMDMSTR
ncbi:hypothetical protein [Pandoraea commovens]|uniref:Uncharacterized protein n=1 Tax=Pandoraea commovens TaxID=2508289 RepID=A0A5E4TV09_9BURK|nr:hypothetical protein [Pandoraea commovens]UVA79629.1 hypothetical protein NTU39_00875 [Pandoraea commovens]VVD91072.1 hypothetical protein PCO31010_01647 [Pandoraea commovens]